MRFKKKTTTLIQKLLERIIYKIFKISNEKITGQETMTSNQPVNTVKQIKYLSHNQEIFFVIKQQKYLSSIHKRIVVDLP